MRKFWNALNEPFPDSTDLKKSVYGAIIGGVFVTFFLYLFQPFNLSDYPGSKFLLALGFGLVSFICALFFNFVSVFIFKIRKDLPSWTLLKWIIDAVFLILVITIGNYLFMNYLMGFSGWSWYGFLMMIRATVLVGVFPILFLGLWTQINAVKKNVQEAQNFQASKLKSSNTPTPLQITSQTKNQTFSLLADQFYYAESMQNYIAVHYLEEHQFKKEMIRNTIGNLEDICKASNIVRCHRSFLVNMDHIENVDGNAQGLRLSLKDLDEPIIPVSRKYIPILKSHLG